MGTVNGGFVHLNPVDDRVEQHVGQNRIDRRDAGQDRSPNIERVRQFQHHETRFIAAGTAARFSPTALPTICQVTLDPAQATSSTKLVAP